MTETYELAGGIRRSLTTITDHWDGMLQPTGSGGIAKAPTGKVTLADDHAETDNDTPRLERLLSLRREVTEALNSWARIIIEERTITHTAPHGLDTLALARFLNTHADWLAHHDAGQDAADELRTWASKVRAASGEPEISDHDELIVQTVNAGRCPNALDRGEHAIYGTELATCGTTVRLPVIHDNDTEIACTGCGTTDNVNGWITRIVGQEPNVTADELIRILHRTLGMRVTTVAIRQWVSRGMIQPAEKDHDGRNLYNRQAVMRAIREREQQKLNA